jgi:hypothetical protein
MDSKTIYDKVVYQDDEKFMQYRITINEFRGIEYFHFRKYIVDFDGLWMPCKEGVSFPLDLNNMSELFVGVLEILSLAESKEVITKHFKELLSEVYENSS